MRVTVIIPTYNEAGSIARVLDEIPASLVAESFSSGLLDYPQFTRPAEFRGMRVPDVLLSGDHAAIERWRRDQALERTGARRPDLLGG